LGAHRERLLLIIAFEQLDPDRNGSGAVASELVPLRGAPARPGRKALPDDTKPRSPLSLGAHRERLLLIIAFEQLDPDRDGVRSGRVRAGAAPGSAGMDRESRQLCARARGSSIPPLCPIYRCTPTVIAGLDPSCPVNLSFTVERQGAQIR
jgi:hypothetical protein